MEVKFYPATREHAELLLEGMTPVVREELEAAYRSTDIAGLLERAFKESAEAHAVFVDDEIVCAMGVSTKTQLSNVGNPWIIPHTNLNKYKMQFLTVSRKWIRHLSSTYPVLENYVLGKNKRALRWLKWLGFTVGDPVTINGTQFYPYRLERK